MSIVRKSSLTLAILDLYFNSVKDLRAYLVEILGSSNDGKLDFLPNDEDSDAYRELISTTYVASNLDSSTEVPKFSVKEVGINLHELIDHALSNLFKSKARYNILTLGYRPVSSSGQTGKYGRDGIVNYHVNTIITALQSPEWETLYRRIGEDAMFHLLTHTSIFVSLPNQCLCQMTGTPLTSVTPSSSELAGPLQTPHTNVKPSPKSEKRKSDGPHRDAPPIKRVKLSKSFVSRTESFSALEKDKIVSFSPADIAIVRVRLFYARPALIPGTGGIVVGLPPPHVLNRFNPAYEHRPKIDPGAWVDPDPRKQMDHARHLAKYVFPRQYKLSSPFGTSPSVLTRDGFKFPNYIDRESEIKAKGSCKTPKRLKGIIPVLEKMIWRHGKCGYKPLKDIACPSKIKPSDTAPKLDSSVILELMSEHSSQLFLRSQASLANISVDSEGNSILPRGLTQAERHGKARPRFVEFACSHTEVYRYAVLVTKAVIPKTFWGSESNFRHIMTHVKAFIVCRRYETLTLHHILQGFSTSVCIWLTPPGAGALKQARVSVTDSLKRREVLEEFIFWYFDSFLLPLLRTTFYITESSAFRNRVLYFRQDDWEALCAPLIDRLTSGTFERMEEAEAEAILRQRKLGFSFVRLLPKDTGVRPIVNLRRKKAPQRGQSINQILQAAFQILTYEKHSQPQLLGASVFSPNEVYARLKDFKAHLQRSEPTGNLPKLYFVKVDVQACFDSIEQTKLLEILRDLISEDTYMMQSYGQISQAMGKLKRTYTRKMVPDDEHPHFLTHAAELAGVLRNTIFVDKVKYDRAKRHEILHLLEEHITENIVKIGSDYYRQTVGIPQGSVLSAILCSFFYGDLEKRFGKFTDDPHSILFRLIDDYLYITTSLPKATQFLDMMNKGHPEYGCFISQDKTLTNFDYDYQIMNVTGAEQRCFPWCGYLIDMKNLSISVDYSRYHGTDLINTLTVGKGRRPGSTFLYKMLQLAKAKSHIIYCDMDLNTEHTVYLNIHQNFMLCAMKMHNYLQAWATNTTNNATFIHNTIRQMISYNYAAIRNKASSKLAHVHHGKCNVHRVAVFWLGVHAFHTVLSRKPRRYTAILKCLESELSRPKHRKSKRRFRSLVKESFAGMAEIAY